MFQSIERRSGELVFFDKSKLEEEVRNLLESIPSNRSQSHKEALVKIIAERTIQYLNRSFDDALTKIPKEEDFERAIEDVLMQMGEYDAARAMIRKAATKLTHTPKRDYEALMEELVHDAHGQQSFFDYNQLSGALLAQASYRYWTSCHWSSEVVKKLETGILEMPEAYTLTPRWLSLSVEKLLLNGQYIRVGERLSAPLTLSAVLSQFMTMLMQLRREASYVLCINHFDTWLAPYVREGELSFNQVKESMQNFIHQLVATGTDHQGAKNFVIRLDKQVPDTFINRQVIFEGKTHPFDIYGSYQYEMDMINRCICEILHELKGEKIQAGHISWRYQMEANWDWQALISDRILETAINTKWISFEKLTATESYWLGSYGLCQINLDRIGQMAGSMEELTMLLESSVDSAMTALSERRDFIEKLTHMRFYSIQNAYQTHNSSRGTDESVWTAEINFSGLDGCIKAFTQNGESLETTAGAAFGKEISELIEEFIEKFKTKKQLNVRLKPNICEIDLGDFKHPSSLELFDEALYGCRGKEILMADKSIERLSLLWKLPEGLEKMALVQKLLIFSFKNSAVATCAFK